MKMIRVATGEAVSLHKDRSQADRGRGDDSMHALLREEETNLGSLWGEKGFPSCTFWRKSPEKKSIRTWGEK